MGQKELVIDAGYKPEITMTDGTNSMGELPSIEYWKEVFYKRSEMAFKLVLGGDLEIFGK